MAARYEELLAQGGSGIQTAQWLIAALLEAEVTDRYVPPCLHLVALCGR
jgi:hypothetical protein